MPRKKNGTSKRGRKGEGRPKWDPSEEEIGEAVKLARMQCTLEEIAAWFQVGTSTIDRRMKDDPDFANAIKSAWGQSAISFKRIVWRHAEDGNSKALGLLASRFGWGEQSKVSVEMTGAAAKLLDRVRTMTSRAKNYEAGEDAQPGSA